MEMKLQHLVTFRHWFLSLAPLLGAGQSLGIFPGCLFNFSTFGTSFLYRLPYSALSEVTRIGRDCSFTQVPLLYPFLPGC